jgi:hypothetical protein
MSPFTYCGEPTHTAHCLMQPGGGELGPKEKVKLMQTPTIPIREALEEVVGAMATLDGVPVDYQKRAFLFIDQAPNASA